MAQELLPGLEGTVRYGGKVLELIGKTVGSGRFEVVRLIGAGGMGAVFEAKQLTLDRRCALKVMLPAALGVPTAKQRFVREALLAARVKHDNIVDIIDAGTDDAGLSYIAMEYLDGEGLDKTLGREGSLAWPLARHIILQVCRALEAAHSRGVAHRDLKPGNCVRISHNGDSNFIKIVDFGIAKAIHDAEKHTKLTEKDTPMGSVDYMAYEQACGLDDCDHRVDVWAVAVILYELVSGCLPFRGRQRVPFFQRLTAVLYHEPTPLSMCVPPGTVPAGLEQIIQKAMLKERDRRYQSITELREALEALPVELGPGANVEPHRVEYTTASITADGPATRQERPKHPLRAVLGLLASPRLTITMLVLGAGAALTTTSVDILGARPEPGETRATAAAAASANPAMPAATPAAVGAGRTDGVLATTEAGQRTAPVVAASGVDDPHVPTTVTVTATGTIPRVDEDSPRTTSLATTGPAEKSAAIQPRPRKSQTSEGKACAALRAKVKTTISACVGARTSKYVLRVTMNPGGDVSGVAITNPLLKNDAAYKCLKTAVEGQEIKGVLSPSTFECQVSP